jgi:phage I-like protein
VLKVALFAGPVGNLLEGDAKSPPKEFRVLRLGWNETTKGRFLFDDQAAELVMRAYASRGLDKIQVDYEHQSSVAPPGGGPAEKPAAGWFKPEVRNGELWAVDLSWTKKAAQMIAPDEGAPEYRYFSPILFFDEESRRVKAVKNLALTNDPAMNGIEAIVAATALALSTQDDSKETKTMPECKSCEGLSAEKTALSVRLTAKEAECTALAARLSAFEEKEKDGKAAMSALTDRHGQLSGKLIALTGQQTDAAALGIIESWKAKAGQTDLLLAEKDAAVSAALTADMTRILDKAVEDKKLAPALRTYEEQAAKAMGGGKVTSDSVAFLTAKWGAAPVVVNAQKATEVENNGEVALTAAEKEAARMLGHSEEFVLQGKKDLKKVEAAWGRA